MHLADFDPAHAHTVAAWADSPTVARFWCSRDEVSAPVVAAWGTGDGVTAHLLLDAGQPVGYGETWIDDEEAEVELARLIVAPDRRGRGVGRVLTALLLARARTSYPAVFLRVHPDNEAARRCYRAAGFTRVPAADEERFNGGQPVAYAWFAG